MAAKTGTLLNQVNTMKFIPISLVFAALATAAHAQAPAVAGKAPIATHSCTKPPLPDASKKLSAAEGNAFVRSLETFRNCVQAFSEGQKQVIVAKQKEAESLKAAALEASAAAVAAAAAVDAATTEYNTFSDQAVKIVTPKDSADNAKKSAPVDIPAPRPQRGY
jgi:hypothetical protein